MITEASWVGRMPDIYDRELGPALFAPFAADLAARVKAAMAGRSPRRVLEQAAGTGILTAELVRTLVGAQITATDLNPAMVAWASHQVPGPDWLEANAQKLTFPDDSFDAVVSQFGVMFFPDRPAAFTEAKRVLGLDGTLAFSVWDRVEGSDFPAAMVASLAAVLPDDPPSFIQRVPHGYADEDQIRSDLRAGGFETVSVERVLRRGHATSARDLTEGFCLGTPLRFVLTERGPIEELTQALAVEMTARLGPGPLEGNLAALVVTATGD